MCKFDSTQKDENIAQSSGFLKAYSKLKSNELMLQRHSLRHC